MGINNTTTMKKITCIIALLSATVFLSGCIEENFENTIKVTKGKEVIFGASANFERSGIATKTEYSGDFSTDGFERVNWVNGDQVYIYCAHEDGDQAAHYKITKVDETTKGNKKHTATLSKNYDVNPNGINWQDVNKTHTFYAMYPAPNTFRQDQFDQDGNLINTTYSAHLSIDANNIVEGFIPVNQDPKTLPDATDRVGTPNMDFAYMLAKQEIKNGTIPENGVLLSFKPIVTAVEFTLKAQDDVTISNVQIFNTKGNPICGPFTTDLSEYDGTDYPTCTPGSLTTNYTGMNFSSINVSLYDRDDNNNIESASITLKSGETVTFTVFMLPVDISDLAIRVDAHGYKTAKLGTTTSSDGDEITNYVTFEAHKKHYVRNVLLPTKPATVANPENWFEQLDPATYMAGLSIPGSANAFSFEYSNETDENYFKTQSKNFEAQWNLGVRCFELVSTKAGTWRGLGSYLGYWTDAESLANAPIRCNNKKIPNDDNPTTIDDAVQKIWSKVSANPREFAMIIFTYQPTGQNNEGGTRDAEAYMNQLNNYYNSLVKSGVQMKKYSPTLHAGDCYGKLIFVARPSQEGEDSESDVEAAVGTGEILTVKGWGSLPDKWTKRGYPTYLYAGTTDGTIATDGSAYNKIQRNAIGESYDVAMESWIFDSANQTKSRPIKGTPDFEYTTDQIDDKGNAIIAWAQEWRRVYNSEFNSLVGGFSWFDSIQEKKDDVMDTFRKSISKDANRVYFNSLDGFYITNDTQSYLHYWAGNKGEIKQYAADMNDWLYKYIIDLGVNNITGPLGVVIMDYVGEGNGGTNLPNIIINNNFKFPLEEDPNYNPGQ